MSCGIGRRCRLDLALLWQRPAAIALIWPLAWESPYAVDVTLKKKKKKKKGRNKLMDFKNLWLACARSFFLIL